ncbi:hypothetical protein [Glaciimonas sp. PAMC28666]|uniref:hypothetical protein n=1 Tax=Glaciimonas sp. PAMC28666 TaxID=2807626 RepID=UPI001963C865|nr:hypothetical protein [Glaciimonas sp. PAMC28666]QRX80890.1 hypothetical protein JQN73_11695 [Glaciimonas sp. PAMC28666]
MNSQKSHVFDVQKVAFNILVMLIFIHTLNERLEARLYARGRGRVSEYSWHINISGCKALIDGVQGLAPKVTHNVGGSGFTTRIELKSKIE